MIIPVCYCVWSFTLTAQFVSSFLKLSFSDLLSQGKHFTEKLKIQTENGQFEFLSKPQLPTKKRKALQF